MISVDINHKFAVDLNNNLVSFLVFLGALGGGIGRDPKEVMKWQVAQNAKIVNIRKI